MTELLIPLKAYSNSNQALSGSGSSPVAASSNSMVDGYTGDFRYSVPLITVPGPNGESVPITAGYHAGIGVNQKASWIGLGWDYSPGEISRSVVGTPDDYNGRIVNENICYYLSSITTPKLMFGALYTKNIKNSSQSAHPGVRKSNDFYTVYRHLPESLKYDMMVRANLATSYDFGQYNTSADKYRFNRYSIPFQALAYDDYQVSGGISGQIHPFGLGQNEFHSERHANDVSMNVNTNKMQFYFANSSNKAINASTATNSSFVNTTTNRIHSGTFVKFYTNTEINSSGNLFDNATQKGFLDYCTVSGTRRPSADFDPDGIGGFEVTDMNGVTYHYSLPVYVFNEYSFQDDSPSLNLVDVTSYYRYNNSTYTSNTRPDKYAISWKLTSVTGADYQDVNNNKTVDEGDSGYWINYNYSLWSNDYYGASQRYGCREDGAFVKNAPAYDSYFNGKTFQPHAYTKTCNFSRSHSQVYTLNYIQTASHTAFFVKSIRLDEQSYENVELSTNKPTPLLKLDRVILIENKNKALFINSTAMGSGDKDSRFSYSTCSVALGDPNFIHVTKYNANKVNINAATLKQVEFVTDYSLAKKYTGNINNTVVAKPVMQGSGFIFLFNTLDHISNSDPQSGKLTLNKINFYELNGEKIVPSVDFDYAVSDADKNPDFAQDKTDLWGYYKKDYRNSHYVTDVSKNNVDAWSLREITTSLGSKIRIEYESDVYNTEGFADDPDYMPLPNSYLGSPYVGNPIKTTMPHLIFPLKSFDFNTNEYTYEDYDVYPYSMGTGRDYSIPSESYTSLIVNYIDHCTRPILYYAHGGNFIPYTQTVRQLVHRGQGGHYVNPGSSLVIPYTGASAYTRGPYTMTYSSYNRIAPDLDLSLQCQATGQIYGSELAGSEVVNFSVMFRSFLYGGGIRVKKIETIEPFKDITYTQQFTYGNGYCPVVPKSMALCYGVAPKAYDICTNFKPLINSQLNSRVGYDYMQTTTVSSNGNNNGSVKEVFYNVPIANPISFNSTPGILTYILPLNYTYLMGACGTYYPTGNNIDDKSFANNYYFSMALNKGNQFLGKLLQTQLLDNHDNVVSKTSYIYSGSSFIEEGNKPSSSLPTLDYFTFLKACHCPGTGTSTGNPAEDALFTIKYPESYNYTFTYRFHNTQQLLGTTTERDGITTTDMIYSSDLDEYTCLPNVKTSSDPTIGDMKSTITYAYKNSAYTNFGLKSVNENYKNQPALLLSTKTTKGKYVIGESKITYSNQYPTRVYDPTTSKYKNSTLTKNWYRVNETYSRLLDDDVLATSTPGTDDWRKTSTGTLYDSQNNRIEEAGLNDRESASKWGYNGNYKLAGITNANYNSFTFSGFEDQLTVNTSPATVHFGGEVTGGQLRLSGATAPNASVISPHTGKYMAGVNAGVQGPVFNAVNFEKARTYVAKVWINLNSPPTAALTLVLNGTTGSGSTPLSLSSTVTRTSAGKVTVGSWVLVSTEITVPDNFNLGSTHSMSASLTNSSGTSGPAYFDDFSFHPKDAVLTGNVYNEANGLLIAQLDNENFATLYNYDNAGRILTTYKEYSGGIKKVTETSYHFAKP